MPEVSYLGDDFEDVSFLEDAEGDEDTSAFCAFLVLSNDSEVEVKVARESLDWLLRDWDVVDFVGEDFILYERKRFVFLLESLSKSFILLYQHTLSRVIG
jgi:hypothetical protein